ncbi:ABC transporter permease [Pseudobacteriovorax antillogorgiicola]|uniref:ABC-type transport system, involved in lipoprotein release, permease component n=1 Tax=Pseudobacteriovorax antillogorgiicola TaxID=1513793 RepID=A0A1Y6CHU8_9BACT|nr:FtsX-like permease family protein [Pseudobacteriovorax antillogorgiicola]TCS48316.1 ABC-type lipoprotein release transport system permease subunit [Pseudobacteriovorax antillogorgiicola]SMF56632.1 ABC-type transport system, involved in lipoprotein release, permease component [Pseudobacteriovorax antillogorgiicola]
MIFLWKQALKQLLQSGAKTWLNVLVLALTIFTMIFLDGLYHGMHLQMKKILIDSWVAQGQLWHQNYDPDDPLSLDEAHGPTMNHPSLTPILILQGSIYPKQRMVSTRINGIPPEQKTLSVSFTALRNNVPEGYVPLMVGRRMAKKLKVKVGESFIIRWRTAQGAFYGVHGIVVEIFQSQNPEIDSNAIWLPLYELQLMHGTPNHASIHISATPEIPPATSIWEIKTQDQLLEETNRLVEVKQQTGLMLIAILMFMIFLSVFDTQALSIFHRRKELGILMALGLTPRQVMGLLIMEGLLYGVLAFGLVAVFGGPVFLWLETNGIQIPGDVDSWGVAIEQSLHPSYTTYGFVKTFLSVSILLTVASYWPARKVGQLQPTQAIRGNWI